MIIVEVGSRAESAAMRVAVLVGAGAMGSIFGAALVEAGVDTLMVDVNPALVQSLNDGGMEIRRDGASRRVSVRATTDPKGRAARGCSGGLRQMLGDGGRPQAGKPLLGDRTVRAFAPEWLGQWREHCAACRHERVLVGVTYMSATLVDAHTVDHTAFGTTYFGSAAPRRHATSPRRSRPPACRRKRSPTSTAASGGS